MSGPGRRGVRSTSRRRLSRWRSRERRSRPGPWRRSRSPGRSRWRRGGARSWRDVGGGRPSGRDPARHLLARTHHAAEGGRPTEAGPPIVPPPSGRPWSRVRPEADPKARVSSEEVKSKTCDRRDNRRESSRSVLKRQPENRRAIDQEMPSWVPGMVLIAEGFHRGWRGSAVLRNPGPDAMGLKTPRGCGVPQTPATRGQPKNQQAHADQEMLRRGLGSRKWRRSDGLRP